jgi:penicillin-binding protein 1A
VGTKTANRLQRYATDTRRPAGSCIKPLSVYAPALEKGLITWASLYDDEPLTERQGKPWPANADGLYRGRVTVGESVAHSLNPTAVRILEELGVEQAFSFAREAMGLGGLISPDEGGAHDRTVSSLALGQQSRGITSRELTAAYTAFYGGTRREAVSYHRVLDAEGKVLLENDSAASASRVLSEGNAAVMTRLLMTVNSHGTAARYLDRTNALGLESAGKTGTTQGGCDRRYVGMTPRLLAGVWMGYDYPAEMRGISGNPCVKIWDELMAECESLYRGAPPKNHFDIPDGVVEAEMCPLSGMRPNGFCADPIYGHPTERGWFVAGTEPRGTCTLHEEPPIVLIPHDRHDPDRIPLLPNDLLPETSLPEHPLGEETPSREPRWFSRWFSRFSHRGPSKS